jgi:hypothetical protein
MKTCVNTLVVLLIGTLLASCAPREPEIPELKLVAKYREGIQSPTQLIFANGKAWLAQLHARSLFVYDNFPDANSLRELTSDSDIESPHFMAASQDGVYVSEGRGSEVSLFTFENDAPGKAITLQLETPMNRPHGVCIDKDNWLYIADSVNSRLIRTQLPDGKTEIFTDVEKKIAYGRQLLCRDDGVWIANSYEKAFKLNAGNGGNILRITDFSSGLLETVVSFPHNNTTGIEIINNRLLLIGRWSGARDIVMYDLQEKQIIGTLFTSDVELDAPYGMFLDEANRRLYITFLGLNPARSEGQEGAILEWHY